MELGSRIKETQYFVLSQGEERHLFLVKFRDKVPDHFADKDVRDTNMVKGDRPKMIIRPVQV